VGEEGRERFIREARACSRINHPNIVTVYSAGEHEGDLYIAMELLEGRTLREILREDGKVPWEKAAGWTVAILSALQRLHDEGIVHRDLKPENIMVGPDGTVKLMDFGIAHVSSESRITVDVSMLGTAQYMSPEQATGMTADARSDIFSMGTILYEMLSGENPFSAPHPMAAMYSIANDLQQPLSERETDLPEGISEAVERALAKEPGSRFSSAGDFASELASIISGDPAGSAASSPLWKRLVIPAAALAVTAAVIGWAVTRDSYEGDRRAAEEHNALGREREEAGDIPGARDEYRIAVISDKRWEIPWNNLAMIALSLRDFDEADSLLQEALERNPDYTEALYNMGTVKWEKEDLEGAEAVLRRAIASDPGFIPAYNNLGSLLLDMKRPGEAARVLDEGLARIGSTPYPDELKAYLLKNRGLAASELGDKNGAETWWRRALEIIPDNEEVRRLLEGIGAL
jgi:Tfp pilus assembly protein PilF